MLRCRGDFHNLQESGQADTLNGLTNTFTVFANFHPPIPDLFDNLDNFCKFGIRVDFNERNGHGGELSAIQNRSLGADTDGRALFQPWTQCAGHYVEAMHAAGAFGIVNLQAVAFHPHTAGRTEVKNLGLDIELTPILI